jgi:hypothetical protein
VLGCLTSEDFYIKVADSSNDGSERSVASDFLIKNFKVFAGDNDYINVNSVGMEYWNRAIGLSFYFSVCGLDINLST